MKKLFVQNTASLLIFSHGEDKTQSILNIIAYWVLLKALSSFENSLSAPPEINLQHIFFLEKSLPACRFGVLAWGHERASLLSVLHVFKRRGKCHSVAVALLCQLGEHFFLPPPSIMRYVGLVRQGTH